MSPITAHIVSAFTSTPISSYSASKNSFSSERRIAISTFLMQEVNDQHTDRQISDMFITAFNTDTYLQTSTGQLNLWAMQFHIPAGETCVVPPLVRLNDCQLIGAGTMEFSVGSLSAASDGGTVIATDSQAVAWATTAGARAIAKGPCSRAMSENDGTAYALGVNSIATAYLRGTAYADFYGSEAHAMKPHSEAHARVPGSRSYAKEINTTATAQSGAWAYAMHSAAGAIAETAGSTAFALIRGAIAYANFKGARAVGESLGKAYATVDGAIEVNCGRGWRYRDVPVATYDSAKTQRYLSFTAALPGKHVASAIQRSGVHFQGRYGNESITADDLGLNDD